MAEEVTTPDAKKILPQHWQITDETGKLLDDAPTRSPIAGWWLRLVPLGDGDTLGRIYIGQEGTALAFARRLGGKMRDVGGAVTFFQDGTTYSVIFGTMPINADIYNTCKSAPAQEEEPRYGGWNPWG